jgi:hypothetical protein
MARTAFKVDLSRPPEAAEIKTHNRWHPDIPMVEMFKPGDEFRVECFDWTGGRRRCRARASRWARGSRATRWWRSCAFRPCAFGNCRARPPRCSGILSDSTSHAATESGWSGRLMTPFPGWAEPSQPKLGRFGGLFCCKPATLP